MVHNPYTHWDQDDFEHALRFYGTDFWGLTVDPYINPIPAFLVEYLVNRAPELIKQHYSFLLGSPAIRNLDPSGEELLLRAVQQRIVAADQQIDDNNLGNETASEAAASASESD